MVALAFNWGSRGSGIKLYPLDGHRFIIPDLFRAPPGDRPNFPRLWTPQRRISFPTTYPDTPVFNSASCEWPTATRTATRAGPDEPQRIAQIEDLFGLMAGLGLFDQKNAIAVTMPIVTAFKFCIRHRKNGLLNR